MAASYTLFNHLLFTEWHLNMTEAQQTGGIMWLESYIFLIPSSYLKFPCTSITEYYFPCIAILQRFLKVEHWVRWRRKRAWALLFPFSCGLPLPFTILGWKRKVTMVYKVTFTYLEVLDQFLDLPVFRRQICVTLRTTFWLLFLLLTLRWTLTETIHWHASCWGLTAQKRADNSAH